MENQQKQYKNELGNIYGSRISKNGNWLNLIIVTTIKGEVTYITCPVKIAKDYDEEGGKKPFARVEMACDHTGKHYADKAIIANLPVYEDRKEAEQPKVDLDLPF